jgi:ketosteroid isomerase-like protein
VTVTGPGGTLDGNKEVAVRFLGHFWAGELEAALALAAPDAVFVNTRSLAEQRRVPLHQALSWIIGDLFSRFVPPGRFDVRIRNALADGDQVMVEYSASGRLDNGRDYANDYVMAFTFRDGQVAEQRVHTDTQHLARLFGP